MEQNPLELEKTNEGQLDQDEVKRGIVRDGQRYYPDLKLLTSRKHGLEWREGAALARSKEREYGKFGSLQDIYFVLQKAAELGLAKSAVFHLPPDSSAIVYVPKRLGDQVVVEVERAKYVYIKVSSNGKVFGWPSLTVELAPSVWYAEKPEPLELARKYREIVALADDVPQIASRQRVSEHIVAAVKDHLFLSKHIIQLGPNKEVEAFFTPINEIAELWGKATNSILSTAEEAEFKRLLAHEYVERGLMEVGFPYHSRHEKAWQEDEDGDFSPQPTKEHYGAHALAPHQNVLQPPFFLWRNVLHLPADGLTLADHLSNLDELMEEILLRVQPPVGETDAAKEPNPSSPRTA